MDKKNVLLIDLRASYVESLLALDNVNIEMLVIDNRFLENDCKQKYGDKIKNYYKRVIFLNSEFEELHKTDYNLTYEEIEAFRPTQLKCEHNLHREILDDGAIQYRYLAALRYWISFFKTHKIDYVFLAMIEHGGIWDSLPAEVAKSLGIPTYIFSASTATLEKEIICLKKANDNSIVNISDLEIARPDFNAFFISLKETWSNYQNKLITWKNPKKHYKEVLKSIPKYIREKYYSPMKKYKKSKNIYKHMHSLSAKEFFEQTIHIHNLKYIYNKLSVEPNYDEKYIYYPLHQEPEASIMARGTMTSQLYVIKLLSENLPSGWKLYVKEHPSEFFIFENHRYFLHNINYFRNFEFYDYIKHLENVELIDINENVNNLLDNSQAVATICGTSLLQAVAKKKNVIVFGDSMTFIEKLQDAFCIKCVDDIKKSLAKISEGFTPEFSDIDEVVKNFVFEKPCYEIDFFHKKEEDVVKILKYIIV